MICGALLSCCHCRKDHAPAAVPHADYRLFGITHPILCGGLQWLADARCVAACVNAGAMGFITALSFPDEPEAFRAEIGKCRELTAGKQFGVSIAFSMPPGANDRLRPYLDIITQEQVRFVETSGGNPQQAVAELKEAGCTVIHKVPAVRYARSAQRMGVDAISVIAGEAGGQPGTTMLGGIVQGVLAADAVHLPLAIGGGMGTGRHLVAALAMGADAMIIGSRMLVAEEIWAHPRYKQRVLAAGEHDTRVVMQIFRDNHRVLDNDTARAVAALEAQGITDFERYRELASGRLARQAYETGAWERGLVDLGPAGVFATAIEPVEAIIDRIIDEAAMARTRVNQVSIPRQSRGL